MMKLNAQHQNENENGLASIVIVTVIIAMLSLVTVGFARIMDKEYRQATDRQLTSEANYAAESGMNDARAYIAQKLSSGVDPSTLDTSGKCMESLFAGGLPAPFVKDGSISGYYSDPTLNTSANDNTIKYTCIIIDTKPYELVQQPLKKNQSVVYKIIPGDSLNTLWLSWQNQRGNNNPMPNPYQLPKETTVTNADQTGVLRATLYPAVNAGAGNSPSDAQNNAVANASRTYFAYPNGNPTAGQSGAANYTNPGAQGFLNGECNTQNIDAKKTPLPYKQGNLRLCNSEIDNLPTPVLPPALTLWANNSDMYSGNWTTIYWTSPNAVKCVKSGDWSGTLTSSTTPNAQGGNESTGTLTYTGAAGKSQDYNYSLQCSDSAGASAKLTTTVHVHSTAMYSGTINGADFAYCVPYLNNPGPPSGDCQKINTTGVFDDWDYEAAYGLSVIPSGGEASVTLNYDNVPDSSGNNDCPPNYSYGILYEVNYSGNWSALSNTACSSAPGSSSAFTGVPGGSTIIFAWNNDSASTIDGTIYDSNLEISSLSVQQTKLGTLPSGPTIPATYIPTPTTGPVFYYLKLTALYQDLNITVQGSDFLDRPVQLLGSQAGIDVTVQGNDTLKRIHGVVSFTPQEGYTIQSIDTLCKRQRVPKTGPSSYDATVLDPAETNPDGACQL